MVHDECVTSDGCCCQIWFQHQNAHASFQITASLVFVALATLMIHMEFGRAVLGINACADFPLGLLSELLHDPARNVSHEWSGHRPLQPLQPLDLGMTLKLIRCPNGATAPTKCRQPCATSDGLSQAMRRLQISALSK